IRHYPTQSGMLIADHSELRGNGIFFDRQSADGDARSGTRERASGDAGLYGVSRGIVRQIDFAPFVIEIPCSWLDRGEIPHMPKRFIIDEQIFRVCAAWVPRVAITVLLTLLILIAGRPQPAFAIEIRQDARPAENRAFGAHERIRVLGPDLLKPVHAAL